MLKGCKVSWNTPRHKGGTPVENIWKTSVIHLLCRALRRFKDCIEKNATQTHDKENIGNALMSRSVHNTVYSVRSNVLYT